MITDELQGRLVAHAQEALKCSYSPYSNFKVGASVVTTNDSLYSGCNIENASYGLTICAERVAIFKMISAEGPKIKIKAILIATDKNIPCSPCGGCRQVIKEFSNTNTQVIYMSKNGYTHLPIDELLPDSFIMRF